MLDHRLNSRRTFEADALHRLIRDRGLHRYGLFFVTQEGHRLPDGSEDASGYVLDESGGVYFFWLGWDERHQAPSFTEWEQVEPEPVWMESAEYQRARARLGLPTTS